MALISVVELTFDPDFVDPCTVVRLIETVGEDGIARHLEQRISILASLQASSADDLVTQPDFRRTTGTSEIITSFPLVTETETTAADEVEWRGCRWVVTSVNVFGNFANWGGHYEGVMEFKCFLPPTVPSEMGLKKTYWDDGGTGWDQGQTFWDGGTRWDSQTSTIPPKPSNWDNGNTEWDEGQSNAV